MLITLSFKELGGQIIAGIPRFVEVLSSAPATIYYTLDGSLPNQLSTPYTQAIEMPTSSGEVILSAVGYFVDGYSNLVPTPVLSNIYRTDVSDLSQFLLFDGIVYMYPNGQNIPFWYDKDGSASVFLDVPPDQIEFPISERDSIGLEIPGATGFDKQNPAETASAFDNDYQLFDQPSSDTFNPEALFILVDGRNPSNINDVLLINGPHMDLRDPRKNFGGLDFYSYHGTVYRSGSFTRHYYDRDREVIVFYYFDSNTGRWVKSIQKLEKRDAKALPKPTFSNPVVFQWFNFGRQQGI